MASGLLDEGVPDGLLPFSGRLSANFAEKRKQVISFVQEVIIPNQAEFSRQRKELCAQHADPLDAPQPKMLDELRAEAQKRGIYNFFLPEVCGLSVLEYSPIAEILGAFPLAVCLRLLPEGAQFQFRAGPNPYLPHDKTERGHELLGARQ